MYTTILIEKSKNTAIISINREDKMNALNGQTLEELSTVLEETANDSEVRGVILTGVGKKSFVAGADILEFQGLSVEEASDLSRKGHQAVMNKISSFSKPIIASINGFALGGGLELAMACHIRVASNSAKLGLPEVSLGIIPGYGGTQRLPQLIGRGRALEMILTGDMITAEEAYRIGLVNHIVPQEELLLKSLEILDRVYLRSPKAVAIAIEAVNEAVLDPKNGFDKEIELFGRSFSTDESKEGIRAFIEKRKPNF